MPACFLIMSLSLSGQKIKLIASSEQSWSGGVAGQYGKNYTFIVEFSGYKKMPVPDTIWMGQTPVPVTITDSAINYKHNTKRTRGKNFVRYTITAGISNTDKAMPNALNTDTSSKKAVSAPINYTGPALLVYHYRGKYKYFVIEKIITTNPVINYP